MLRNLSNILRSPKKYRRLTHYCMFIGYPRSGHSLVGSVLDAHPDCVISHELDALKLFGEIKSRTQLFELIENNSREYALEGRKWTGYSYDVPGQWQGRSRRIQIIGDKKGGSSTDQFDADEGIIDRLEKMVRLPIKIIHVIRNPFDIISTRFLKGKNPPELEGESLLDEIIKSHIRMTQAIARLRQTRMLFDMRSEDLKSAPRENLVALLKFLGLGVSDEYLDACAEMIKPAVSRTRDKVAWTDHQVMRVNTLIDGHDFLSGYTYL